MRPLICLLSALLLSSVTEATSVYVGHSGAPGRQTCASSCHGQAGGTVVIEGFPAQYAPSQTYLITIKKLSGASIRNFNGSVRRGTGSVNAGLIGAGLDTETYNVTGETNGVHLSTHNHDSAQFVWTAPPIGTGVVRLYAGAFQGTNSGSGLNSTIVLIAAEAPTLPGPATAPSPYNGQTDVDPATFITWTAGIGAESHDLYFGTEVPPPLLIPYMEGVFFDPDPDLTPGTVYYWRVDARNSAGVTPGDLWQFTVMDLPDAPANPLPEDGAVDVGVPLYLEWTPGDGALSHDVYLGPSPEELVFDANVLTPTHQPTAELLPATTYYWRIDGRNPVGVTPGPVWSFTTEASSVDGGAPVPAQFALGAAYPNPFNASVTIPFALPQATEIELAVFDLLGREVAVLARGAYAAGAHRVQWTTATSGSGIYLIRLSSAHGTVTGKIVALK